MRGSGRARASGAGDGPGGGSPTLTEAQDSEFPDRVWLYRTPTATQLDKPRRHGERRSRLRALGRQRLEVERRRPADRRVEQHGRRADRGRHGRRAGVHGAAQGRAARRGHRLQPRDHRAHGLHARRRASSPRPSPRPADGGGHAHLRRAHRGGAPGRRGRATPARPPCSSPTDIVAASRPRTRRRSPRSTTRTSASSRSACSRPSTTPRRSGASQAPRRQVRRERDARAARADLHDDRPAALERVRRQLPLAPAAERQGDGARRWRPGSHRRPRPTRRRLSTSRRRARSRRPGSTRSSRRPG